MGYYRILLLIGAVVAMLLVLVVWKQRRVPGAQALIGIWLSSAWWLLSTTIPLPALELDNELLLRSRLAFLGIVWLPAGTLIFALRFTGGVLRVPRAALVGLAIEPVLVIIAVATPALHESFFGAWRADAIGGIRGNGPLFAVHTWYSYALLATSFAMIFRYHERANAPGRRQARVVLLSFLVPVLCNAVFLLGLSPHDIDFTPLGLVASTGLIALAVLRNGFLDLVAGAHEKLMRVITDGIVVIDRRQRIVDSNPAAWDIMQYPMPQRSGLLLANALPELPAYLAGLDNQPATIEFVGNGGQHLELRVFAVVENDSNEPAGQILILRDISEEKANRLALREANERLRAQLATIEEMQATLREQALRDALTGLYNRRYLAEALHRELTGSRRSGVGFAVAMIDIDRFKSINDVYGHAGGDAVLQSLGTLLGQRCRPTDSPCRFGGEEFCVILQTDSIDTAVRRVDEWREQFAALVFCLDGAELTCTFSAGVASYPADGDDETSLLAAADRALYAAKAAGRNQVRRA